MTSAAATMPTSAHGGPVLKLSDIVGGGYNGFWNTRKFYRIVKGAKGSKKSATTALWYIYHMMKYPEANVLVIRKIYATLRQSCYTDLLWAIDRLGVTSLWKATTNPLQLEFVPTGQVILFRGLDEAQKLASIRVRKGYLCWVWFEEFYEISSEDEFNKIEFSIRGYLPPETGLWKQITGTFNPWSEHTWIKARFFDDPDENTFVLTTTYKVNEWLGDDDRRRYEDLYIRDPRNARVICDGDWGVSEGLIYTNWVEEDFDPRYVVMAEGVRTSFGLDFGYAISYNAFVAVAVDLETYTMWIYDEMYERGMTNLDIARRITEMGYAKEMIWADAAEPKSIYELQQGFYEPAGEGVAPTRYALPNIRAALKGPDSVLNGIARVQQFRIIVHPRCINTIRELSCYCWEQDRDGKFTGRPIKEDNHCLAPGTMILTDRGEVPIEDVREGDMVMTHLGYRRVLAAGITRPTAHHYWCMTCKDGSSLLGTYDHPFPRDPFDPSHDDTVPLYRMQGMIVAKAEDDPTEVVRVEETEDYGPVYDLTVEEAHTFYANGILTLNCMDALRYSLTSFFIKGRGHVAEAKGMDGDIQSPGPRPGPGNVSRRVVSA